MAKQFMEENGINWWTVWPSESPDINPIEMVWNQMKRNIARSEPILEGPLLEIAAHTCTLRGCFGFGSAAGNEPFRLYITVLF
jgi:transposase